MTNILIPTDFSITSVKMAEQAVNELNCTSANIILFHAFSLPSSPFDLLVRNRHKPYFDLITDSFRQACKLVREQNMQTINKIQFKCMEGSTNALFRNFVDANEIDVIFCPEYYQYKKIHALSLDPRSFFRKSGIKLVQSLDSRRKEIIIEKAPVVIVPVAIATAN